MTPEALNAPAYLNEVAVFEVSSKKKSLHIMRFNNGCQGYWLLKTAIQVMLIDYPFLVDAELQESVSNISYSDNPASTKNTLNLSGQTKRIKKK
jgi:hypothetical protein